MTASEHRIYFLLQRAARRVRDISDALLVEQLGITTAQAAVLMIIGRTVDTTQREIARELQQNESAIAGTVTRLVRDGFIRKRRSQDDGRAWTLTLTESGADTLAASRKAFARVNASLDSAIESVDAEGASQLAATLSALSKL